MNKFAGIALTVLVVYLARLATGDHNIHVVNNCRHTVWVGTNGDLESGHKWSDPAGGGFELRRGAKKTLTVEDRWSGRVWGRTGSKFGPSGQEGPCETGRCGNKLRCAGQSGEKPATLAEVTFDRFPRQGPPMDYYAVSLVEGYNLRMRLKPRTNDTNEECRESSCPHDMTKDCPTELQVKNKSGKVIGCDSKKNNNGTLESFREYAQRVCPNAYVKSDDEEWFLCDAEVPGKSVFDINFC